MDRQLVASGPYDALRRADNEYRLSMPDVFAKVDAIKRSPCRLPPGDDALAASLFSIRECVRCGEDFVAEQFHGEWQRCRTRACGQEQRIYEHERKRTA